MARAWSTPFRGGTKRSIRSVKRSAPTRSLFLTAAKASSAASSAIRSRFVRYFDPKACDGETSRRRRTVRSRSSTYFFTWGTPVRAVTFQSMARTSSPGTYSRTSENSMPRPRKTEWYSPPSPSFTRRLVRIRIRWIFFAISRGSMKVRTSSGDFDALEDPRDDLVARHVLRLRLVRQQDAVAQDVERDALDVLGDDVAAPLEEGVRARRREQGQGRAGRRPVRDEVPQLGQLVALRVARGRHQLHEVVLQAIVGIQRPHEGPELADLGRREDGPDGGGGLRLGRLAHLLEDLLLLGLRRIAHFELHQEPVDLRLGEGVGPFLLDRV